MSQRSHYSGLTSKEVEESRRKNGTNVLTPPKKVPLWRRFLEKFSDPLIIILLVAGVLSLGIALYECIALNDTLRAFFEPLGIFFAVILATGIAFVFELKADKEFSALNQVGEEEKVIVIRNGHRTSIPKIEVVVGDIVVINTGDEVPADGILLESNLLKVNESTLTGELLSDKSAKPEEITHESTYPANHLYRGTKVMEGNGILQVFAIGDATEYGKVYVEAQIDSSVRTPLNEQLDNLAKFITITSYVLAGVIVFGRVLKYIHVLDAGGVLDAEHLFDAHALSYYLKSVMLAVTLIVVAVPEGLPMAVSLSLAYSMRKMLKMNNLVRRMHACETMGAVNVICTDKTGTLTQNRMTVNDTSFGWHSLKYVGNDELDKIIAEDIAVNSSASLEDGEVLGNPTEGALLLWLRDNGIDYNQLRNDAELLIELPFSTERKMMAVVVRSAVNGQRVLYVKGAPELVYQLCKYDNEQSKQLGEQLANYQSKAMRTLGFAYKVLRDDEAGIVGTDITAQDLSFLGVVAISDPVREDVPAAVGSCHHAGVEVKIVTGDTLGTAIEIGRQIGVWDDSCTAENYILGNELEKMSDEQLYERVGKLRIIARARPMDKKRLVEALQHNGNVVAVTGDGTNDAPALNVAHVGLSMGDGTAVAKEASDITIVDNSFASIVNAVMWGRSLYRNIQRFILFQMVVNVAACLTVVAGAFLDVQSPLTVTQMLWINLIMDTFAAMALASLPPSVTVMDDPPRNRKDFIINHRMWKVISLVGITFFLILLGILLHFEDHQVDSLLHFINGGCGDDAMGLSIKELTIFFHTFVFLQFWNLFNAKSFETKGEKLSYSRGFIIIVTLILVGQFIINYFGGEFFSIEPLSLIEMLIIIVITSLVMWVGKLVRYIVNLRK